jgi:hypothetical protein
MQWMSRAAALCAAWAIACAATAGKLDADFERQRPSADARQVAEWAIGSGDPQGRPFLIVDKKDARLYVFEPGGRLLAATPVILGASRGDHSEPGVGERAQTGDVGPEERTTPAGRFVTHPGRNLEGERVIWIDYAAAFALHRLRPGRAHQVRASRLESSAPHERRLSLGCVVVPVAFYLDVIEPLLGSRKGVVYVLPETQSARDLFLQL